MPSPAKIRYFGWSGLSIETRDGALFFDPFFRPYCGAECFISRISSTPDTSA